MDRRIARSRMRPPTSGQSTGYGPVDCPFAVATLTEWAIHRLRSHRLRSHRLRSHRLRSRAIPPPPLAPTLDRGQRPRGKTRDRPPTATPNRSRTVTMPLPQFATICHFATASFVQWMARSACSRAIIHPLLEGMERAKPATPARRSIGSHYPPSKGGSYSRLECQSVGRCRDRGEPRPHEKSSGEGTVRRAGAGR